MKKCWHKQDTTTSSRVAKEDVLSALFKQYMKAFGSSTLDIENNLEKTLLTC